jgi:hypothetical protein
MKVFSKKGDHRPKRHHDFTPKDTTTTASKPADRKPECCPGSIIADKERPVWLEERPAWLDKYQSFANSAEKMAGEKRIEEVHKQAGALITNLSDIKKSAQDHFEYEPIPAYDAKSHNKDAHERALQQKHQEWLRNESYAWVAQHNIEQIDPYSFMNTKEFKDYRDAIQDLANKSEGNKMSGKEEKNILSLLEKLYRHSMTENTNALRDLSEAHIIMDNVHKGRGSINGVYMDFREIKSIGRSKDGNVLIEFRQDNAEITVKDEFGTDLPWTKRFAAGTYTSQSGSIKIEIPGNKCDGKERTECIIHHYDADGKETGTQTCSTKDLKKIQVIYHGKDAGKVEQSVVLEFKTMPDGNVPLNQKFSYDKLQNAFRINLRTGMLIMQDGQFSIPVNKLDFLETQTDPENGIVFYTNKEHRPIPLEILGSLNTHFKPIQVLRSKASNQADSMRKNMLDFLQAAQRTNDPTQIADAFAQLDSARAYFDTYKANIVKEIQHVPANEKALALMREQQKFDSIQSDFRDVRDNYESAKELTKASNKETHSLIKGVLTEKFNKMIRNRQVNQDVMNEIRNNVYKAFGLDDGKEYTIEGLSTFKMTELAQEYEKHISKIKDLTEDDKENIEKYINAENNALKDTDERKSIREYIKSANKTISDLSAEDQIIIRKHAEAYINADKQAIEEINEDQRDLVKTHARAYIEAEKSVIGDLSEDQQEMVRTHAIYYITNADSIEDNKKAILKNYASKYIEAEKGVIGGLNEDQQKILRKHARVYITKVDRTMAGLNLNKRQQKLIRERAIAYRDAEGKAKKVLNLTEESISAYIIETYNAIKHLSEDDKQHVQNHLKDIDHIKYAKDIENSVNTKGDVYLKNDIYLIKASNSANSLEAIRAIANLDPKVDYIDDPDKSTLKGQRQTSENTMFEHLTKAADRAKCNPNLIWLPLYQAMFVRQRRLNSLKHVENALSATTTDDIKKHLQKLIDQPSLKVSEIGEEFYEKQADNLETRLNKLVEDGLKKDYSPAEYQKRATDLIQMTSTLAYQHLLDAFKHDPEALRDLKARRVDILLKMSDQSSAALNTALRLRNFEQQKGLMFKMMTWEIYIMSLSMGQMRLQQFEGRIGNIFHRLMSEVFNTGL